MGRPVHFGAVRLLSAVAIAPWDSIAVAILWGLVGVTGVMYTLRALYTSH